MQLPLPTGRDGTSSLAARYDAAASGWARRIASLGYAEAYREMSAHALESLSAACMPRPIRMLDAGCGAGDFALAFAHAARSDIAVDLVDVSAAMLARADAALSGVVRQIRPILAPLSTASLATDGYDVALCAHLLEHVPSPEAAAARLRAALSPGGMLLLVANRPHWCTRLIQMRWRTRSFDPGAMERMLADAGFKDTERVGFTAGPPARTSMGYIARA